MNTTVSETADKHEPVDLDADLTEFERYARDCFPTVSPKSPYYKFEERAYDYSTWVGFEGLQANLFPEVPTPVWHSGDAADAYRRATPIANAFVSDEQLVLLRREQGVKDDHGVTCASFGARLVQAMASNEPMIQSWTRCLVNTPEGAQMGYAAGTDTRMTLDEAVEIANVLLLLVEVARDTAAEQA